MRHVTVSSVYPHKGEESHRPQIEPVLGTRLTVRQRATLSALAGLGSVPIILFHGRSIFQPYISEGGYIAAFAWIALFALYYVSARTALDLCRDFLDYINGRYFTAGGEYDRVDQRRKKEPPFDLLSLHSVDRAFSTWQFTMMGWMFLEVIIGWIAFAGMFYTFFRSPYPGGIAHPLYNSTHAGSTGGLTWFSEVMSYLLVGFSLYSIGYRWELGVTPLIQRCLGTPDAYPGQNKFPQWVNELAIKCFGKPM